MAINRTKIKRQLYANGGLGQLVDREKFGIGSSFKKAFKKVTKPVVKVAQKLVPKEIAGPLMMAAPFLGPVYGPIAYAAGSAKKTGRIDPVKLALVAAPYVKFQGGEGIGAFKPVGYGGSQYGIFGGKEIMYDFPTSGTTTTTFTPSGAIPEASEGAISRTGATVGMGDTGVIVPQPTTPTTGPVSLADVAGKYFEEPLEFLKTKEFPQGRSLKQVLGTAATSPQALVGGTTGVIQYIQARKEEIENAGGTFDKAAYEAALKDYYSQYKGSFERGFSNQGGLSQLAPRKKYGGGMSDNRVSQLLLLREEAMTNGDDDKVAELDQELDLILRPGKEDGTTEEDIVSMTDEGRSGVIYMTPDGKQIDKETFLNMTDQEENDEEDTEETQSMMTPIMPQPKPSFMKPNAIVAPILEAESQEYIKQNLGKKDGGRIGFKNGTKKKDEDKEDDIDAQVEKEIKEETPSSYDFMIGLSPLTYARKYLKKKEIEKRNNKANGGIMQARKQYGDGSKIIEINPYELVGDTGETVVDFYYGGDIDAMVEAILPENFQGTYTVVRPANKKDGGRIGYMEGGIKSVPIRTNQAGTKELDYRAKGGFVPIGVKERADDVPAMLSKNEFVMTADAVRGAGGGNINKGARKMYNLMKNLETRRT